MQSAIDNFAILKRPYYLIDKDISKTLDNYKKTIEIGIGLELNKQIFQNKIPPKTKCRIMSYNVRYFTAGDGLPTIKHIVDTILTYNPHIVCLQEIALGQNKYYGVSESRVLFVNEFDRLLTYYHVLSVCSSPPGFFMTMYGNMILIRKELATKISDILDPDYSDMIRTIMCSMTSPGFHPCYMNQQVFTYQNVPPKKEYSSSNPNIGTVQYQEQSNENKCFIKIVLPYFDVICVHLDAYYKKYRLSQLEQINNVITRPTVIIGDFNFFNINDFTVWIRKIYQKILLIIALKPESQPPTSTLSQSYITAIDLIRTTIRQSIDKIINQSNNPSINLDLVTKTIKSNLAMGPTGRIISSIGNTITHEEAITRIFNELVRRMDDVDYHQLIGVLNVDSNTPLPQFTSTDTDINKGFQKINEINAKITSMEEYFKDKSGSILTNDEFNYCIKELKWTTIDPTHTINISQWSGTRVDMAFFAKFPLDSKPDHYLLFVPPDKGSDHLPLIIDIPVTDSVLQESLVINSIDLTAKIEPSILLDTTTLQSRLQGICNMYKPIRYINIPTFSTPLYNGQPVAEESFDWVIDGKFTRLTDPFVTAGTSDLHMGRLGTYLSTSLSYTTGVATTITQQNLKQLETNPNGLFYAYLLFEFKYIGPDFSQIRVGKGQSLNDKAYKECYDLQADILRRSFYTVDEFVYKIPERNVQQYLQLNSLKIGTNLIDEKSDAWKGYLVQNVSGIPDNEDIINRLTEEAAKFLLTTSPDIVEPTEPTVPTICADSRACRVRESPENIRKKVVLSYYVILNSITNINNFSTKKYQTRFVPIFEPNRLSVCKDEDNFHSLCYEIDLTQYKPTGQTGGLINTNPVDYHKKYIKYKILYHALKKKFVQ